MLNVVTGSEEVLLPTFSLTFLNVTPVMAVVPEVVKVKVVLAVVMGIPVTVRLALGLMVILLARSQLTLASQYEYPMDDEALQE